MYNRIHWINIIIRVTQYIGSYLIQNTIQLYINVYSGKENKICTTGAEQHKKEINDRTHLQLQLSRRSLLKPEYKAARVEIGAPEFASETNYESVMRLV